MRVLKVLLLLRVALLVLAGVLAAFLIAQGTVAIGVIVGAMAALARRDAGVHVPPPPGVRTAVPEPRERFFGQMASSRPRSAFRTDAGTRSPSSPS